jgi:hypothetical protein
MPPPTRLPHPGAAGAGGNSSPLLQQSTCVCTKLTCAHTIMLLACVQPPSQTWLRPHLLPPHLHLHPRPLRPLHLHPRPRQLLLRAMGAR